MPHPLQVGKRSGKGQPNRPAGFMQNACSDKAITAIVPGAAQHHHRTTRPPPHDGGGHGATGCLHQRRAGHAAGDGESIGFRHFRTAQERKIVGGSEVAQRRTKSHGMWAIGAADRN